ncbi:MAG: hypothetical protein ACKOQM_10200 [Novosphingobium sp.]
MTKRTALSPKACTAIAAVLAAVSTPVFAQDTAVPDPSPAPAPAAPAAATPAPIVLPEFKPQPVAQPAAEPSVAMPEPAADAPVATTTAARATPRQATRSTATVAAAPAVAKSSAPATTSAPVTDTAPITPLASPAPVASAEPVVPPTRSATSDNTAEIGLGLLGLVALGGIGAYATSRRRRRVASDEFAETTVPLATTTAPRAAVAPPAALTPQPAWRPASTTVVAASPAPFMFERKPETSQPAKAPRVRSADLIPVGLLPTGAAMTELFERMVNAAPDKDNPFKSDKRRRARVRWLLKQHEYRLADPEGLTAVDRFNAGESGFDFRTYKPSSTSPIDEGAGKEVIPA